MAGSKGPERSKARPPQKRASAFSQRDECSDPDRDRAIDDHRHVLMVYIDEAAHNEEGSAMTTQNTNQTNRLLGYPAEAFVIDQR
jgi:hypothetical protein